jgi:uncharacterized coiled-coil DUF342 family protein
MIQKKVEKIDNEVMDKLRKLSVDTNKLYGELGELHIKLINYKEEMEFIENRIETTQSEIITNNKRVNAVLQTIQATYKNGTIDMDKGEITYLTESADGIIEA